MLTECNEACHNCVLNYCPHQMSFCSMAVLSSPSDCGKSSGAMIYQTLPHQASNCFGHLPSPIAPHLPHSVSLPGELDDLQWGHPVAPKQEPQVLSFPGQEEAGRLPVVQDGGVPCGAQPRHVPHIGNRGRLDREASAEGAPAFPGSGGGDCGTAGPAGSRGRGSRNSSSARALQ